SQLSDAWQGAFQDVKELVGASQKVTHGLNLNSHGGIFHAHGVLQGGLEDRTSNALDVALVIQRSNNQTVAQVEIGLPVNRVIFIRQAMCQIAAPGQVTVGNPLAAARKEYSVSSHLINSGSGCPLVSATTRGNRHIHQPLYSTSTRRCSARES